MTPSPPPEPSAAPLRPGDWRVDVWRAFLRAHSVVVRQLERDLMNDIGMPLAWYDVLLQLCEAPGHRLRMADLADRVLLSRSGLTRLIDRLAAEGLVRREPSPHDARGTYTVVTQAGMDRMRGAAASHLASVDRAWMRHYTAAELEVLGELLDRLRPAGE